MRKVREPGWLGPSVEVLPGQAAVDPQLDDLAAYCRAVTGQPEVAVAVAHDVLGAASSLLNDPHQLRAWLFANARVQMVGDATPGAQEIMDLVHQHGIRAQDLPLVLGVPPADAREMLAAAEEETGWYYRGSGDGVSYLNEDLQDMPTFVSGTNMLETQLPGLAAYCRAVTGREDVAVSIAHDLVDAAHSLLNDPVQLRAWLFANARLQMVGDATPGAQEIMDLVNQHGIRAEDLPVVLGISPFEVNDLLAAAENEYATAGSSGYRDADPLYSEEWHDDSSWDNRAAAWASTASWDHGAGGGDGAVFGDGASFGVGADWDDGAGWDGAFGPRNHHTQNIRGLFSQPSGRHAAPDLRAVHMRQALIRGPVRAATATGIVVGVIGVSAAYLASTNAPPHSAAGHQAEHRPSTIAQVPGSTPSPRPTTTTSQPVTVVLPSAAPTPAPTSPRQLQTPASSSTTRALPQPSPTPGTSSPRSTSSSPTSPRQSPTPGTSSPTPGTSSPTPGTSSPTPGTSSPTPGTSSPTPGPFSATPASPQPFATPSPS